MKFSALALATGVLYQAQQVQAWWGVDYWFWMNNSSSDPIAMQKLNDPDNYKDRCRPSDDCWPTA